MFSPFFSPAESFRIHISIPDRSSSRMQVINVAACFKYSCSFLLMLASVAGATTTSLSKIFLNSYSHCAHNKFSKVFPDVGFLVTADASPGTGTKSFRDCEANFRSKDTNGRLCIVQEGRLNEITDPNAELLAYDGSNTDDFPRIFTIGYENEWLQREYCTKSSDVTLFVRQIDKNGRVDVRKVYINLKILDIESRDRKLYLDEAYCNRSYPLSNSQVSVFNRPFFNSSPLTRLSQSCSVTIEKDKTDDKSICFVYVPSKPLKCNNYWTVTISSEDKNITFYKLDCQSQKVTQLHVWCGGNQTHQLSLNFKRSDEVALNSSLESPEMFRFVFADHEGSPESLLERVKQELLLSEPGEGLGVGLIIGIIALLVLLLVTVLVVYWKWHDLPCFKYKVVHNPGNSATAAVV